MRIGFIGTHQGMSRSQKDALRSLLAEYRPTQLHHYGSAGADEEADAIFLTCCPSARIVIHSPATGYLARNRELIRRCDMLVAAPETAEEQESGEVWSMIRYARVRNVTTVVLHPDSDGSRAPGSE